MAQYIKSSPPVTPAAFPEWILGAQRGGVESDRQYYCLYTDPTMIRTCALPLALQSAVRARLGCSVGPP